MIDLSNSYDRPMVEVWTPLFGHRCPESIVTIPYLFWNAEVSFDSRESAINFMVCEAAKIPSRPKKFSLYHSSVPAEWVGDFINDQQWYSRENAEENNLPLYRAGGHMIAPTNYDLAKDYFAVEDEPRSKKSYIYFAGNFTFEVNNVTTAFLN